MEMRNHEGYHDPTAGKAIRRADRVRQRGRGDFRQYGRRDGGRSAHGIFGCERD